MLCMMPARSMDVAVVVELSVNGMDTSEQGLVYRYEQMPTVERVRPAVVTSEGRHGGDRCRAQGLQAEGRSHAAQAQASRARQCGEAQA